MRIIGLELEAIRTVKAPIQRALGKAAQRNRGYRVYIWDLRLSEIVSLDRNMYIFDHICSIEHVKYTIICNHILIVCLVCSVKAKAPKYSIYFNALNLNGSDVVSYW